MPSSTEAALAQLVTPFWVTRTNLYPNRPLADAATGRSTRDALITLARLTARREALRDPLVEHLHALAPRVPDDVRHRVVLPLKRAVFNRRPPGPAIGPALAGTAADHPELAHIDGLDEWLATWDDSATAALDAAHEPAVATERAELVLWASDPDVRRSVAVTSRDLLRAVTDRAGTPADRASRGGAKTESALVQYHSRSTVRVSPFSLYTGVHVAQLDGTGPGGTGPDGTSHASPSGGESGPHGRRSVPALRHVLLRHAARRLLTDPRDAAQIPLRLSAGHARAGGFLEVHRRHWAQPTPGMKADGVMEDVARLPLSPSLDRVVDVLLVACDPDSPGLLPEALAARLAPNGLPDDAARTLVDQLRTLGLLLPVLPVPEQSPDALVRWHDALAPMDGAASATMRRAVTVSLENLDRFSAADAGARVRILEQLSDLWSDAVGARVEAPLVEDCYIAPSDGVTDDDVRRWADDTARLRPLLDASDDQRLLGAALETVFVQHYGVGGTCTDLRELARHAYAAFPLTQRLVAGETVEGVPERVRRLLAAHEVAAAHLIDLQHRPVESAAVDPAMLEQVAALLPPAPDEVRSVSVFGQPAGHELVVNHVYGGQSRYFSRYLHDVDPAVTEGLRAHDRRLNAGRSVQVRPVLGFNANLSPLLAERELALADDPPSPAADRLRLADLRVIHTPDGLRVRTHDGEPITIVYTGFLVPHALPSDEMLLAILAGAPYFSFGDLTTDLHARYARHPGGGPTAGAGGSMSGTARITCGDLVLFRRRWVLPRDVLVPRPGETPPEHFRRVNVERIARGIPDQVFLRPLQGRALTPMERVVAPKPQHVDLLSRLHVAHVARLTQRLGEWLLVEEMTPVPGPDEHASEIFFEVSATEDNTTEDNADTRRPRW
ncbi:hypothetical protein [Promicromonospora sp. NPDC090134]|uniref:hypothetical protein n=1 Tax=Promicromonospora sp. NPDC090134 TaxID=3364408 RepID=UPI00381FE02A